MLILDCCFSGAINYAFKGEVVDSQLNNLAKGDGKGIYILTASTADQPAKQGVEFSILTKHILAGIRDGKADFDEDGFVSMSDLFEYVKVRVPEDAEQTPTSHHYKVQGNKLFVARSFRTYNKGELKAFKKQINDLDSGDLLPPKVFAQARKIIEENNQKRDKNYFELLDQLSDGAIGSGVFAEKWLDLISEKLPVELSAPLVAPPQLIPVVETLPSAIKPSVAPSNFELILPSAKPEKVPEKIEAKKSEPVPVLPLRTLSETQVKPEKVKEERPVQLPPPVVVKELLPVSLPELAPEKPRHESAPSTISIHSINPNQTSQRWRRVITVAAGVLAVSLIAGQGIRMMNSSSIPEAAASPTPPVQKPIPKPAESDRIVLPNSYRENLNGVSLEMIQVPAGKFTMGSDQSDDEQPPHQVSVPSFYMGKYEVTQKQWQAVMGANPASLKGDDLPVETVSWLDARAFCAKLQELTGNAYRLPSEAEWEYACRAGTTGDYAGSLDAVAWYDENSGKKMHPVGQKKPNAFGLYDMHGNVWEWCEDAWHENYNDAPMDDPPKDGSVWTRGGDSYHRVLRGGSYYINARNCRAATRDNYIPVNRSVNIGFRCVISARTL